MFILSYGQTSIFTRKYSLIIMNYSPEQLQLLLANFTDISEAIAAVVKMTSILRVMFPWRTVS